MNLLRLLWLAVVRLFTSAVNNHGNIFWLVINFCINFSPIFIWLTIFKNAGIIPHNWRPTIHVKLIYYVDLYYYSTHFIGLLSGILTMVLGYLMYLAFFKIKTPVRSSNGDFIPLNDLETQESVFDINDELSDDDNYHEEEDGHPSSSSSGFSQRKSPVSQSSNEESTTQKTFKSKFRKSFNPCLPPGYSPILITLLVGLSWPLLNIDYYFAQPDFIAPSKDIFAWILYVLCHLIAPIATAVYLYVFQPPGALKYFSIIMGCENIAGVITHLLFPNAPPWFIHLNGLDVIPDYEMPGFAAGLTRVDVAMGTHLNSKGFHKSPIVFGAFPSLHSAMAVQSFLHLNYYSSWWFPKFLGFFFVIIQWWATIYLDHHFRLDLFCGLIYAYTSFIIFKNWKLGNIYKRFHDSYMFEKSLAGTNMGMRVFKGTKFEWFFNPYS